MERRFDMTNFEQSLKEQADQFDMIPSKKVWHGIYNDLHPGSKWPSIAMGFVFLFTLLGIGHLNNTSKQFSGIIPSSDIESGYNSEQKGFSTNNSITKERQSIKSQNQAAKIISIVEKSGTKINPASSVSENNEKSQSSGISTTTAKIISLFPKEMNNDESNGIEIKKLNGSTLQANNELFDKIKNTNPQSVAFNAQNNSLNDGHLGEPKKDLSNIGIDNNIAENKSINADAEVSGVTNNGDLNFGINNNEVYNNYLPVFSADALLSASIDPQEKNKADLSGHKKPVNIHKKRNEKIRWVYFVTPSVTTATFIGKGYKAGTPNSSPIILQNNQHSNGMIYNPRLGYEVGIQMSYAFSKKWEFLTGTHLSYSGFNVISNQVHPTFATLLLKDESSGLPYSQTFITHYGNGEGQNQISLANYSLQVSLPVGLQYALFNNNKIQIKLASTIEPSFILKSNSYIISSDQRYYVNDPTLLRKINLNGNIGSYVTFKSNKVNWQIGPNFRYQLLSTYQNIYPIKEHLMDYGIRIGISR
jgi:hypothetical protein